MAQKKIGPTWYMSHVTPSLLAWSKVLASSQSDKVIPLDLRSSNDGWKRPTNDYVEQRKEVSWWYLALYHFVTMTKGSTISNDD